jgi:AcrR family transcriptional regulator
MPEHENRTRRELDEAMRTLLARKPLDQLRVRELTELSGLRRQSFYYHFKDIYDLFAWSVRRERRLLLERQGECLTWEEAMMDLMARMEEERPFYAALLDSRGRAGLREALPLTDMLEQTQVYYRERCGVLPDPEGEPARIRCWEAILLSLLEGWVRGDLEVDPRAVLEVLRSAAEQHAAGAVWQTLRAGGGGEDMPG